MNQYYDKCENCFQHNESVERAIKEFGHCNQTPSPKVFYSKKDIVVANESAPRICFCKECWKGIQEADAYE